MAKIECKDGHALVFVLDNDETNFSLLLCVLFYLTKQDSSIADSPLNFLITGLVADVNWLHLLVHWWCFCK